MFKRRMCEFSTNFTKDIGRKFIALICRYEGRFEDEKGVESSSPAVPPS